MTLPRIRVLPTLRLAWVSVRSFFRAPLPLAALIALAVVPLLYSGLYLWSFWDPFGRMDNLPVALVNEDKPVTVDGERLQAGQDITNELLEGGELDWHLVDADEAASGVDDGRYYVSLTIPEDFSANLASPSEEGATPVPAMLKVQYNDANSYIVRELLGAAFKEIKSAAGKTATSDYLNRMFLGFNEIHGKTMEAADGAGQLADGTDDAKDGSSDLFNGLGDAKEGSSALSSGLGDAKDGSSALSSGLGDAKEGSSTLSSGLGDAEAGAGALSAGIGNLYQGSRELAAGATSASEEVSAATATLDTLADTWVPVLRRDAPAIASTARAIATAANTLSRALADLPDTCGKAAAEARKLRERLQAYLDARPELEQRDPELYALLTDAREAASLAARLDDFVQGHRGEIAEIQRRAARVAALASALAAKAPTLAADAEAARDKVDALDAALAEIAQGSRELRDGLKEANTGAKNLQEGIGELHSGAQDLDAGIGRLHSGAQDLDAGIGELRSGAQDLDAGIGQLHSGAGDLDEGIGELQDGAHELADSLLEGAGEIPTFDADDRDKRGDMMSTPVRLSSTIDNKAPNYGTGFAPFFIALSLWVGAMVVYIVLPPLSGRGLVSTAPSWRIALAGWLPALAIGVAQVALMMAVLHYMLGLEAKNWPGVLGLLVLSAAAFTAVVHWLVTRFGAVGKGIALILLMLQLTSAGGTYPIETSPDFFQEISPYLPMSHVVEGLRHLISGGELATVWEAVWVLTAYLVGALLLTWMSVERRRTWSMKDLHPPLKI
ncbi:YhgE/Pip domain-containing protein [Nocardiopsis rhodophaea]|uniref:YhgE/Pip domain-containing protein n=1 Tax=Nocardiopsis rhodophaea TaxID=280238 RepID=UPI0031D451A7